MDEAPATTRWAFACALFALAGACGGSSPKATGAGGAGAGGGGTGGGVDGAAGAAGGHDAGGDADGAPVDAGPQPPSCAPGGPGLLTCGAGHESCCTSLLVTGGSYDRTYDPAQGGADAGADAGADPATISDFRLDKYDVTVGRFRQFVKAVGQGDGGAGWRPTTGDGKHAHLAGGLGVTGVGGDAGVAHEPGWLAADDVNLAPTDANLTSCGATSTWTAAPGSQEDLPINCVNWWEAYAFCIWDGGFLPSEAEWEYAAAGGAEARAYPWGSTDPGTMNRYAIYDCHYPTGASMCTSAANIAPVGTATLGAGRFGQLDLAGNESQWNLDFYGPYVSPCTDCARLSGGSRIVRGGGFGLPLPNLAPPYRDGNGPALRNDYIGIRCARSP
jgi:formylglycine-generating enzyme required for sulfatase activity